MSGIKRKKLMFLASFPNATSGNAANIAVFPCTQFRASYAGDVYGGVLDALDPLTVGSPGERIRLNDVQAWVRPIRLGSALTTDGGSFRVEFCAATTSTTDATTLPTSGLKTAAGGTVGVDGLTPVLTRHFGVKVTRTRQDSDAVTGVVAVYVQRQHTIEV